MTQEEKELLLKDLCARLPYRVKCRFISSKGDIPSTIVKVDIENETVSHIPDGQTLTYFNWIESGYIKPYLRPMSSMTEEEKRDFEKIFRFSSTESVCISGYGYVYNVSIIDWLNTHHFDYRGLVDKGLALESPEGMYE